MEDVQAFQNYVVANELFEMLDWKANVKAVEDFLKEFGELPPGVKFTTTNLVGVRRS